MRSTQALKLVVGYAVSFTFGGVLLCEGWQFAITHRPADRRKDEQTLVGVTPLTQGPNSAVIRRAVF
jgi:hypothetical protein